MLKRLSFLLSVFILALWFGYGCAVQQSAKVETVVIPGGTVVPALGVGFDANYDPSLDNVVPGYKIVTVAFTNNSMNLIQMDPSNDVWVVEDRRGKKIKAITDLRGFDPDVWGGLPKKLKVLIEYPLIVPIGTTKTIDLLFKNRVNLGEFKSVIYRAANSKQEYKILPREE